MEQLNDKSVDRLFDVISRLNSKQELIAFFEDVCTIKEIMDMAQRLDTAILLDNGERYQMIAEKIGTSTATISRVSRCLHYGSGGYRKAIDKLETYERDEV